MCVCMYVLRVTVRVYVRVNSDCACVRVESEHAYVCAVCALVHAPSPSDPTPLLSGQNNVHITT